MDDTEVGRIEAWVGHDVGKAEHHASVLSAAGEPLFERSVRDDEAALEQLLERAGEHGRCVLVIDQPGSIGSHSTPKPSPSRRRRPPAGSSATSPKSSTGSPPAATGSPPRSSRPSPATLRRRS